MDYSKCVYVASCVFTECYPQIERADPKLLKGAFDIHPTRNLTLRICDII